jgi:DNA polymerase elongation subunit (family B)
MGTPEHSIISRTLHILSDALFEGRIVCGWNIHRFDLPYITKRAWLNRINHHQKLREGRYFNRNIIDLMSVWGNYEPNAFAQLKSVASILGVATERDYDLTGKDWWKAAESDPELARQYLTDDLMETVRIADIIL